MIEDKDVKIAKDPIEALWETTRKATEQRMRENKIQQIIDENLIELCKKHIN